MIHVHCILVNLFRHTYLRTCGIHVQLVVRAFAMVAEDQGSIPVRCVRTTLEVVALASILGVQDCGLGISTDATMLDLILQIVLVNNLRKRCNIIEMLLKAA